MSLLDRLSGAEDTKLPVHQFWASIVEWSEGEVSRGDIISAFALSASEENELDWLKSQIDGTADKVSFLNHIHSLFMLAESKMFGYDSKSSMKKRLERSSGIVLNAIDAMEAGTWLEVANSNLSAVYATPAPGGNQAAIMSAWNGGAYDTARDMLLVWGGGHNDYYGNEQYGFSISDLSWSLLTAPSTAGGTGSHPGLLSDETPKPFHTYNSIQYVASIDKLMSFGVQAYSPTAGVDFVCPALDMATLQWDGARTVHPGAEAGQGGTMTAYNAVSGDVYVWIGNDNNAVLQRYNAVQNTWTAVGSNIKYVENYNTAAIDPINNIMVSVGSTHGLVSCDLNTGIRTKITVTGDTFPETAQAPGFVFNSVTEKFVFWNGGVNLYEIDPNTWICTQKTISPSNTVIPTAKEVNGTYGRFQFIPSKNAYIGVNRTTENVFIFKE